MVCSGREAQGNIRGIPLPGSSGIIVQLVRHLASDLRKHVVGAAANQSDRSNHDHQNYRKHHRVFGDVLTAFLSPKLMDCLDHCLPPIDDKLKLNFLVTIIRRRVIVKIS